MDAVTFASVARTLGCTDADAFRESLAFYGDPVRVLSQRSRRVVLLISHEDRPNTVIKIKAFPEETSNIMHENDMHALFSSFDLCPRIFASGWEWVQDVLLVFLEMEEMVCDVASTILHWSKSLPQDELKRHLDLFVHDLDRLVRDLERHQLTHGDLHLKNIALGYTPEPRLYCLDMEYASHGRSNTTLEWLQLLHSILLLQVETKLATATMGELGWQLQLHLPVPVGQEEETMFAKIFLLEKITAMLQRTMGRHVMLHDVAMLATDHFATYIANGMPLSC